MIPVYNEADRIGDCLRAIAAQTVRPLEVIVVDNNSTDETAAIARLYPFVTVIREPRQGVVHARNLGFDAARGDIIGRLDADSRIASDWVETVQALFGDASLAAVTGKIRYYDIARAAVVNRADLYFRRHFARVLGREVALQGANMALRRSAWQDVRRHTCSLGGLHEDFDLAIHLNHRGHMVRFDERLEAAIGFRQTEGNWREFTIYAFLSPRTYARHGLKSQRHMYPVVWLAVAMYIPLWSLHRGFDADAGRFSWGRLFTPGNLKRVNPATYVD